tara:strand:+ start:787 stop:1641 length:855 start_codon:yes stop_codon:yes gene_type:complete
MTEEETTHKMLMELIKEECEIDTSIDIEYPELALSYGEKTIETKNGKKTYPTILSSLGNISYVTAPPKSKKSFFISLLASVYLSNSNNFGGNLKGHRNDKCLIHIDTEQGRWHASRCFKKAEQMANIKNVGCYQTYALRTLTYKQRLQFLEWTLQQNKENGKETGMVFVDGAADMVADVNDLLTCNEMVSKLMQLSTLYNTHIMVVMHQNFGSQKLGTGHLGSFLEKKSETVIELELNTVNKDWVTVMCKRSRGFPFETFSFSINKFGLPFVVGDIYDPLKDFK